MRYAVPGSNGELAPHFGHWEEFAITDVDEVKRTIVGKKFVASPEHQPGLLPPWLANEGVSAVIAGGMGSRAQMLLKENGIVVKDRGRRAQSAGSTLSDSYYSRLKTKVG